MTSESSQSRPLEQSSGSADISSEFSNIREIRPDYRRQVSQASLPELVQSYRRPRSDYTISPRRSTREPGDENAEVQEPAVVAKNLARRSTLLGWFENPLESFDSNGSSAACIAVKSPGGEYVFNPNDPSPNLAAAISRLGEKVVMSMTSEVTELVIDAVTPDQKSLVLESTGARIPVVASLDDVHQSLVHSARACVVMEERCVLIWSNEPSTIINVAHGVEKQLLSLIVGQDIMQAEAHSVTEVNTPVRGALDEKDAVYVKAIALEDGNESGDDLDLEGATPARPTLKLHSFRVGLVVILVITTQGLGVSRLLNQYMWDGRYLRFCLAAVIPGLVLFSLAFFVALVSGVFQLFLPCGPVMRNSKYHSAIKPNPKRYRNYELPHITVQMPVYKEGLRGVIVPTMVSVMAAIQFYEEQGGTASVFINDDGMQCIQEELAEARKQYYRHNGIAYVARLPNFKTPAKKGFWSRFRKSKSSEAEAEKENESAAGPQNLANSLNYVRKGKFKKASNMNYCLAFSNRVEDELRRLSDLECQKRGCSFADLTASDDNELYKQALANMLAADENRTWAEGNIRIGELILLIDCDTRMPVDGLLYGALEMHESPEVTILQHSSGVMQVAHNVFENGITFFTNIVYTAIKYGVGIGDVSPFVGHNAFLRWKGIQSIQFVDPTDGETKWWSDAHVSEDFDISLRVQMQGMIVRLATYHNGGFQEGVSLSIYDELNRWEKYAYGCNELVLNPVYQWVYKGPITRLFLRFLWSNVPVTSKVTIVSYIFTYYAIGAGFFLCIANYFLVGLFPDDIDHFYIPSWGVWCGLVVIFNLLGPLAFSMVQHRVKEKAFWDAFIEAIKWLPFLVLFFGGISLNCAKALFCHAFSINIEWAATEKELGPTGFYVGLDKMVRRFKIVWTICLILAAGMIYMAVGAPWGWQIAPGPYSTASIAIAPLAIQISSTALLPLFLGLG